MDLLKYTGAKLLVPSSLQERTETMQICQKFYRRTDKLN